MNTGHHQPRLPRRHPAQRRSPAFEPPKPPSAARLAAEALFTGREETFPPAAAAASVPVVVLKKRAAPAPGPLQPPAEHDAPAPSARAPRVFTLSPPATKARAAGRDVLVDTAAPSPEPPQAPSTTQARPTARAPRADRIGHDTRARVIRHVMLVNSDPVADRPAVDVHEASAQPLEAPQPLAANGELDAALESPASLLRQLARLDSVFADIRRARDFTLVDEQAERLWLRLSQRADQLARELVQLQAQAA